MPLAGSKRAAPEAPGEQEEETILTMRSSFSGEEAAFSDLESYGQHELFFDIPAPPSSPCDPCIQQLEKGLKEAIRKDIAEGNDDVDAIEDDLVDEDVDVFGESAMTASSNLVASVLPEPENSASSTFTKASRLMESDKSAGESLKMAEP